MADQVIFEEGEEFDDYTREDLGQKPVTESAGGGQRFSRMVPPTVKGFLFELEDGTKEFKEDVNGDSLKIDDWVKGVSLTGYEYKDDSAIFEFTDLSGGTIRKFIGSPHKKQHIMNMEKTNPQRAIQIGYTYTEVESLFQNFMYVSNVQQTSNALKQKNLRVLCEALWELYQGGKHNTTGEVFLKLAFKTDTGLEPKYVIPQKRYLGNANWLPKWSDAEKNSSYNDKQFFTYIAADPDFEDQGDGFGGSIEDGFAQQAADANDVLGGDTLAVPSDVDFL